MSVGSINFGGEMLVELSVSKTITQNVESVCPCIQRFIYENILYLFYIL